MDENQDDQIEQDDQMGTNDLKQKLEQATDMWKRTAADFENYKRRKEAESQELTTFAREVTVAKLLPTLDTLEQALKHMPEYPSPRPSPARGEGDPSPVTGESARRADDGGEFEKKYQNWQVGISGLVMQLDKVLEELGVKKIESVGKKFDPNFHEAVREVAGEEDGMVVDELQSGFELNGKVIRPSQVVISKKNE